MGEWNFDLLFEGINLKDNTERIASFMKGLERVNERANEEFARAIITNNRASAESWWKHVLNVRDTEIAFMLDGRVVKLMGEVMAAKLLKRRE